MRAGREDNPRASDRKEDDWILGEEGNNFLEDERESLQLIIFRYITVLPWTRSAETMNLLYSEDEDELRFG